MKPGQRPGPVAWGSSVKWGMVPSVGATQSGPILLPPGTRGRLYWHSRGTLPVCPFLPVSPATLAKCLSLELCISNSGYAE